MEWNTLFLWIAVCWFEFLNNNWCLRRKMHDIMRESSLFNANIRADLSEIYFCMENLLWEIALLKPIWYCLIWSKVMLFWVILLYLSVNMHFLFKGELRSNKLINYSSYWVGKDDSEKLSRLENLVLLDLLYVSIPYP